jgi:DNA polymerase-1
MAHTLVTDEGGLAAVAFGLADAASERVGLDVETTGLNPRVDRIRLLSLSIPGGDGQSANYLIDCFTVDPSGLWAALAECEVVGHNLSFDLSFLSRLGFSPGQIRDTMLLSQVLYASAYVKGTGFTRHGLKDCCQRELGIDLSKELQASDWTGVLSTEQLDYAAADVQVLIPLHNALTKKLAESGLERTAALECSALPCIAWMASKGVPFDRSQWSALANIAEADTERIASELNAVAPPKVDGLFEDIWNWDSPEQVKQVLSLTGHPVESTSDGVLAELDNPIAKLLRDYRDASKRVTTYGNEWANKHVAADNRIYANWSQLGANSGRMACGSPNLQNIKRDGAYRKAFAAPPGRIFVKGDYSQIELRIAAKISGDTALLAAYQCGEDLHALTAKNVLGIQEVTKQHRQLAKAINFGLLYGMGAKAFRAYANATYGVELSEAEAQSYRDAFFRSYPGLRRWHRSIGDKPVDTRTLIGRRVSNVQNFTEKLNLPVQGSGADGLKAALALLWERRDECPDAFPILAVHDEIVIECDADSTTTMTLTTKPAEWLRRAMIDAMASLVAPVPVEVDVKIVPTWGG